MVVGESYLRCPCARVLDNLLLASDDLNCLHKCVGNESYRIEEVDHPEGVVDDTKTIAPATLFKEGEKLQALVLL